MNPLDFVKHHEALRTPEFFGNLRVYLMQEGMADPKFVKGVLKELGKKYSSSTMYSLVDMIDKGEIKYVSDVLNNLSKKGVTLGNQLSNSQAAGWADDVFKSSYNALKSPALKSTMDKILKGVVGKGAGNMMMPAIPLTGEGWQENYGFNPMTGERQTPSYEGIKRYIPNMTALSDISNSLKSLGIPPAQTSKYITQGEGNRLEFDERAFMSDFGQLAQPYTQAWAKGTNLASNLRDTVSNYLSTSGGQIAKQALNQIPSLTPMAGANLKKILNQDELRQITDNLRKIIPEDPGQFIINQGKDLFLDLSKIAQKIPSLAKTVAGTMAAPFVPPVGSLSEKFQGLQKILNPDQLKQIDTALNKVGGVSKYLVKKGNDLFFDASKMISSMPNIQSIYSQAAGKAGSLADLLKNTMSKYTSGLGSSGSLLNKYADAFKGKAGDTWGAIKGADNFDLLDYLMNKKQEPSLLSKYANLLKQNASTGWNTISNTGSSWKDKIYSILQNNYSNNSQQSLLDKYAGMLKGGITSGYNAVKSQPTLMDKLAGTVKNKAVNNWNLITGGANKKDTGFNKLAQLLIGDSKKASSTNPLTKMYLPSITQKTSETAKDIGSSLFGSVAGVLKKFYGGATGLLGKIF